ncbi:MAG: DUF1444 family protein [Armatimonadota bacterium]|nr:DUF1444 family protein [Armatimonadota bacterium]
MPEFRHPAHLYRLWYPADWEVDEDEKTGTFSFAAKENPVGQLDISVYTFSQKLPLSHEEILDMFRQAMEQGEKQGEVQPCVVNGAIGATTEYVTEDATYCRHWFLVRGQVGLFITYSCPVAERERERALVDDMIGSLLISEEALDAHTFTQMVLERCRVLMPDLRLEIEKPLVLVSREGEGTFVIQLQNIYQACLREPDKREEHLKRFLEGVVAAREQQKVEVPTLKEVRHKIMPQLKTTEWMTSPTMGQVAFRRWVEPLVITYVIDDGKYMRFIPRDWLEVWGLSINRLHELAIKNLVRFKSKFQMVALSDGQRVKGIVIAKGDSYDAARLLLPDFYAQVSQLLGREFLVAVPSRDCLMAFCDDDPQFLAGILRQVREDARHDPYPLTDKIFRYTPDGLMSWEVGTSR